MLAKKFSFGLEMNAVIRLVLVAAVALVVLTVAQATPDVARAHPKSLYLIANHHTAQFDAWDIGAGGTATYQASYSLSHARDPGGVAIDESSTTLFVTSEFDRGVEFVDATTMTSLGWAGPSDPQDLAGIAVDDAADTVYAVIRWSSSLYAYDWNPVATTLTLKGGYPVTLPNCQGAYGIALDEVAGVLWVADAAAGIARAYDTATWTEDTSKSFTPAHQPVDIAVDRLRHFVYTVSVSAGAWTPPGTGSTLLSKWDLVAPGETTGNLPDQGVGVAVDELTGFVYVTLSPYGRSQPAGDLQVWDTSTSPSWTQIQLAPVSGSPAGICIPQEEISFDFLNLSKSDGLAAGECVSPGGTITYDICYDNTANAFDVHNVTLTDTLPAEVNFVSATAGGTYNSTPHTVTWTIGTLVGGAAQQCVQLTGQVDSSAVPESTVINSVTIDSDETPPTTKNETTEICAAPTPTPTPTPTPMPTPTLTPTPTPTPAVGGIVDINVEGSDSLVASAEEGSAGSSLPYHIALAGAAAVGAIAVAAGTLYARRRLS